MNFPGVSGTVSPDRCPLYAVIQEGRKYRVTVQMRVRAAGGGTKPEGGLFAQAALPESYTTQREANGIMEALNLRVYREVMAAFLEAKYGEAA